MNKNKIWETETLRGTLWIANRDGAAIHRYPFEIPSDKAIGPKAKQNILEAAGISPSVRCKKHSVSFFVGSRVLPTEHFCFRNRNLPDIDYEITLENDFRTIRFDASKDPEEKFSDCLSEATKRAYNEVEFRFCSKTGRMIRLVNQVTELRHLYLFNCHHDSEFPIFQEIGQLEQLRGLCLHGAQGDFILNRSAIGELRKLKKMETLSVQSDFLISSEALPELGTLKTLKALNLELRTNCDFEFSCKARAEALSFLRGLENLEILTLQVTPRLLPGDLALPPNLKYLSINGRVCRLPVRPAKKTELKNE